MMQSFKDFVQHSLTEGSVKPHVKPNGKGGFDVVNSAGTVRRTFKKQADAEAYFQKKFGHKHDTDHTPPKADTTPATGHSPSDVTPHTDHQETIKALHALNAKTGEVNDLINRSERLGGNLPKDHPLVQLKAKLSKDAKGHEEELKKNPEAWKAYYDEMKAKALAVFSKTTPSHSAVKKAHADAEVAHRRVKKAQDDVVKALRPGQNHTARAALQRVKGEHEAALNIAKNLERQYNDHHGDDAFNQHTEAKAQAKDDAAAVAEVKHYSPSKFADHKKNVKASESEPHFSVNKTRTGQFNVVGQDKKILGRSKENRSLEDAEAMAKSANLLRDIHKETGTQVPILHSGHTGTIIHRGHTSDIIRNGHINPDLHKTHQETLEIQKKYASSLEKRGFVKAQLGKYDTGEVMRYEHPDGTKARLRVHNDASGSSMETHIIPKGHKDPFE